MSGGGGEANTVSEFKPPDYTQDYWKRYVGDAAGLTSDEMPRYQGQTVAGVNQQQQLANSMLVNNAMNGTAAGNEANSMLYLTMNGAFDNPYATTLNPYGSESQYMDDVISRSNNKISDAYARGTQGSLDRAHALSRTMGNAQGQIAQSENDKVLAEQLSSNTSNLLNQNYYANQGIAENQLNRASGALDAERNRQMQAAGMAPGMQNMDLQAIQALMGGGDALRGYEQDLLNSQMQDWTAWMQSPYAQQDVFGSALTRASGGAGTTSSQIMQGMNPMTGLLGAGTLAASMFPGGFG